MPSKKLKKYKERLLLSLIINSDGIKILPYSSYKRYGRSYIILNKKLKQYKEYVRRRVSYNISSITAGSLASLCREEERLKFERD